MKKILVVAVAKIPLPCSRESVVEKFHEAMIINPVASCMDTTEYIGLNHYIRFIKENKDVVVFQIESEVDPDKIGLELTGKFMDGGVSLSTTVSGHTSNLYIGASVLKEVVEFLAEKGKNIPMSEGIILQ